MIKIDDLDGAGKVLIGDVPDPFGAVGDDHFLLSPAPATLPGFGINAAAEFIGILNRGRTGCGGLIAHRAVLFIRSGLCEHAAQLHFARARRLSLDSSGTAFQFWAHHRNRRAVHFDIQHGNRGPKNRRQFQLQGASGP